jgi:hypothetical protein
VLCACGPRTNNSEISCTVVELFAVKVVLGWNCVGRFS